MTLAVVVCLAAATVVLKGAGSLLPRIPDEVATRLSGLAPALLAALVVSEVVGHDGVPQLDEKVAGVAAAVGLAALRAPLAITVIAGAATAAALRAIG